MYLYINSILTPLLISIIAYKLFFTNQAGITMETVNAARLIVAERLHFYSVRLWNKNGDCKFH